jgi:hypothetical protein
VPVAVGQNLARGEKLSQKFMETHPEYMDRCANAKRNAAVYPTKLLYPAAGIRNATQHLVTATFVSYPTDAPPAYPEMRPQPATVGGGCSIRLKGQRDRQKRNERLLELIENNRVDSSAQGRLTKR